MYNKFKIFIFSQHCQKLTNLPLQIYITIVEVILIVITLSILILEVFLSLNNIEGDTISGIISEWAYGRNFFITFAWGIVTGHLFLGSKSPLIDDNFMSVLVVVILACITVIVGCKRKSAKVTWVIQAILLISGAIIGHFTWSMNDF